jgi:hypothetical protein
MYTIKTKKRDWSDAIVTFVTFNKDKCDDMVKKFLVDHYSAEVESTDVDDYAMVEPNKILFSKRAQVVKCYANAWAEKGYKPSGGLAVRGDFFYLSIFKDPDEPSQYKGCM